MWVDPLSERLLSGAGLVPTHEGRGPVVLMYHSICAANKDPADRWTLSVNSFEKQLSLLKSKGWTTVCVRDLLKADSLPPRTVVISFDDGYADNYQNAFRLLKEYGMCGTWFVVSRKIGAPTRLDAKQLKEMAASGMEIGAHTRTHVRLPELDRKEIEIEVGGSKNDLEDILGRIVTSFAYPYGLFDEVCVDVVKESGFDIACTTRTGWFGSEPDLLRVRRVAVFPHDSISMFARKLAFAGADVRWRRMLDYFISRVRTRLTGYEAG